MHLDRLADETTDHPGQSHEIGSVAGHGGDDTGGPEMALGALP